MTLSAGDRLGRYEILAPLGAGGMGEVYRARDTELERDVAIKVLPEKVAQDEARLARFQREAKVVAKLSHPNILEIHDYGREGDITYSVTELLEGETLRGRLEGGALGWRNATEIGAAIADGLVAAHGAGIVHRDLKPSNVFLTRDGRVKVLDFGLARHESVRPGDKRTEATTLSEQTDPGTVLGTVGYMSPEQVRGQIVDHRSDIFSLGSVLYEMVSGQRAFTGDSAIDTMSAILKEEPPNISSSGVELPAELAGTIQRCLEKRPEARFQSASDLAYNLRSMASATAPAPVGRALPFRARWTHLLAVVVAAAIAVLVVLPPEGIWQRVTGVTEQPPIRTIAVLPLENLTGDPEQAYFVDGLHEELIATFSQISAFDKVIARTSVMSFRDSNTPVREIGKRLDVAAVIEGSVRRSGDTVRATLQLIDARNESPLWADSFERELTDILVLHTDIARAVASEVQVALSPDDEERLVGARPVNHEAYEAYLKGKHFRRSGLTHDNLMRAIGFCEQAIESDPAYAPARVELSKALRSLTLRYRPPTEVMPRARQEVMRALELDPDLAEAHAQLGSIRFEFDWNWAGAEAAFRRALELNPNSADALTGYAFFLVTMGRFEEAVAAQQRAVDLDPVSAGQLRALGWVYWYARRYDDGIEHLLKTIELHPNDYYAHFYLSWNYDGNGLDAEAEAPLERARELHPAPDQDPFILAVEASRHGTSGRPEEADETLSQLLKLRSQTYVPPWLVAVAYAGIGDKDRAIEWLERAYESRDTFLQLSNTNPALDPLRSDPRFQDIMRRMNFPEN